MAKWGGKSSGDRKRGGAGYRPDPEISEDGPTVCPACKGAGFISREHAFSDSEDEDHKSDFDELTCGRCNGTGRL